MTKRPERNFLKPTQISKHLYCSICTEVFLDPTRLFCGHTFCQKCITEWSTKNKSCPICRKDIELGLMGKDLISEKIIMDLEVLCSNRLCDWKDRLENLPKHLKTCAFTKTPSWLNQAQNFGNADDKPAEGNGDGLSMFVTHDEHFIERVNEEVSRKSLLERLYTKNEETKELVDSVFNNSKTKSKGKGKAKGGKKGKKNEISKSKSMEDYDNFFFDLGDSDEETKEDQENQESSGGSSKKESITSKQAEETETVEINEDSFGKGTAKSSQNKSQNGASAELGEDAPEEAAVGVMTRLRKGRSIGKTQKNSAASDPNLVKKVKTAAK